MPNTEKNFDTSQKFYDEVYYKNLDTEQLVNRHYRNLAKRLNIQSGEHILDIACGTGGWLLTCKQLGALTYGIDISEKAIAFCKKILSPENFHVADAEQLPFPDHSFDVITCLGSLEHFRDQKVAIKEILRVAKTNAKVIISVPNSGFLTRRLGLYRGTQQADYLELVLSLAEWQQLFMENGLAIKARWKDLHVCNWKWISQNGWRQVPVRFLQAAMLPLWPLDWQYQVYHLCVRKG